MKSVLQLPLLIAVLTASTFCGAQQKSQTTYVLVHGAWGGSWAFKKVDSIMTAHGNVVYRPSLTGQGERVHLASTNVDLSTHIDDVVNMILFEDIKDIVLMGHSYGGMVVTGVADRIPERIRKLIYLDAFLPVDGEAVFTSNPEGSSWLKQMEKDGMIVPPWVKADQPVPKDVPQSVKTFTEAISLKNQKAQSLPAVYILTVDPGKKPEEDTFYKFAERAKKRNLKYIEMIADHNPQWSKVDELVKVLEENK
jgi:pimeloyl-ACP methyl ester carboxylesterase